MHLKETEIAKLSKFFTTLWNMTKLYGEPENTEKYWDEFSRKCSEMMTLYDGDPLVMELINGLHNGVYRKLVGEKKWEEIRKRRQA